MRLEPSLQRSTGGSHGSCVVRPVITNLTIAAAIVLVTPFGAEAQLTAKALRIGVLVGAVTEGAAGPEAFRQGLRERGYVEGQNITVEWRWARGDVTRLPDLARELVNLKVDVIVANSNLPIQAAQKATKAIPIVMVFPIDPVALGFVASLPRPGGNTTGLTLELPGLHGKRLQLLKEAVPNVARVAVLWDPGLPAGRQRVKEAEVAAPALGLRLQVVAA